MTSAGSWLVSLVLAFQFLSVAPPLVRRSVTAEEVGRSVVCFPIVGLALGAILAGIDLAIRDAFPALVTATLIVGAGAVLTGGLHLDGLLDCADGLLGGRSPEHRLEILKDSHVGAFGIIAGCLILVLQVSAVASLPHGVRSVALVVAPLLGRVAMAAGVCALPYVREAGLGRWFADGAPRVRTAAACLLAAAGITWWAGATAVIAITVAVTTGAVGYGFARLRIGGATGDVYGAVGVLVETTVLTALTCRWVSG